MQRQRSTAINKICFWLSLLSPSYRDKSSTSNMKIDTLAFLGCILAQHPPKVFHPHIHVLVPVSTCISVSSVVTNIPLVSTVNLPGLTRYQNLLYIENRPQSQTMMWLSGMIGVQISLLEAKDFFLSTGTSYPLAPDRVVSKGIRLCIKSENTKTIQMKNITSIHAFWRLTLKFRAKLFRKSHQLASDCFHKQ